MNNAAFKKTMKNSRKHKDVQLVITERKKEPLNIWTKLSYYKVFRRISISNRNKKITEIAKILIDNPVYLGLLILELSKTLMYEFWYGYVKPKHGEKAKFFYMDRDSFIVYIKTDDIYNDIAEDAETRFDTSNLPKGKNKKVIRLMKEE